MIDADIAEELGPELTPSRLELAELRIAGMTQRQLANHFEVSQKEISRRLREPAVSAFMAGAAKLQRMGLHLDSNGVLERVLVLADANLADFLDESGELVKDLSSLPPELMAAVQSYEETTSPTGAVTRKLKLHSRLEALRLLGRHEAIGAWRDRVEVDASSGFAERMQAARARSSSKPELPSTSTTTGPDTPSDQ